MAALGVVQPFNKFLDCFAYLCSCWQKQVVVFIMFTCFWIRYVKYALLIVTTFVNTSGKCINQISTKSSLLGSRFLQHEPHKLLLPEDLKPIDTKLPLSI